MDAPLPGNLDDGFRGNHAISRAAFLIQKTQHFLRRFGVCGVPQKSAGAANVYQSDLTELFEMVRKGGRGNTQLLLDLSGDHSRGVSGEKTAHNLQARLGAESGEAVGTTGDEQWVGFANSSRFAELRRNGKGFVERAARMEYIGYSTDRLRCFTQKKRSA
jgi:hypothetical protein